MLLPRLLLLFSLLCCNLGASATPLALPALTAPVIDTTHTLPPAALAAVAAILGKIPTVAEYLQYAKALDATAADTYRYLNFNEIASYTKKADAVILQQAV